MARGNNKALYVGDTVCIHWPHDKSDGKIATIASVRTHRGKAYEYTCYIQGFEGHEGDMCDGRKNYWYVRPEYLELIGGTDVQESDYTEDFLA